MSHDSVAVMGKLLQHLQLLTHSLRSGNGGKGRKKTWWRQFGLLIPRFDSASCRNLDADLHQHPESTSSSPNTLEDAAEDEVEAPVELGSQARPVEIPSSGGGDEPRRSSRAKRSTRALELQQ